MQSIDNVRGNVHEEFGVELGQELVLILEILHDLEALRPRIYFVGCCKGYLRVHTVLI
jgi:hypothetical protein